jgi:transposase
MAHLTDDQFDVLLLNHPKLNSGDRKALGLMLEVLRTGVPWQDAPSEEYGVGWRVCWERYKRWNNEGWLETLIDSYLETLPELEAGVWRSALRRNTRLREQKLGQKKRNQVLGPI